MIMAIKHSHDCCLDDDDCYYCHCHVDWHGDGHDNVHDDGHADYGGHDGGMVMVYGTGLFKGHDADRDDGRYYGGGERRKYGHIDCQYDGHVDGHCVRCWHLPL